MGGFGTGRGRGAGGTAADCQVRQFGALGARSGGLGGGKEGGVSGPTREANFKLMKPPRTPIGDQYADPVRFSNLEILNLLIC